MWTCSAAGSQVGRSAALIGAGGIGFDVAEYLVHEGEHSSDAGSRPAGWPNGAWTRPSRPAAAWFRPRPEPPAREVWLLQRSAGKPGARLGKTSGWVHRATLKAKKVQMLGGVEYLGVDDAGLKIRVEGVERLPARGPRRGLRRPGTPPRPAGGTAGGRHHPAPDRRRRRRRRAGRQARDRPGQPAGCKPLGSEERVERSEERVESRSTPRFPLTPHSSPLVSSLSPLDAPRANTPFPINHLA